MRRIPVAALLVMSAMLTVIVSGVLPVTAQDATPPPGTAADIGVVDAASRTLWNLDDPTAPVYLFTVLVFASDEQAAAAFTRITDQASGYLGSPDATPEALASAVGALEREDVVLGDEAVLYYQPDETGAAGIATLFVRDGLYLHQWSTLPVPLQVNALLVDPASLSAALRTVGEPWFAADREGDALAHLPGLREVGTGYSLLDESSGIDDLSPALDPGTPVPGA